MAEVIDEIVNVTTEIDLSTAVQENFGTLMLMKQFDGFDTTTPMQGTSDRYRVYASLEEVSNDGWGEDSDVYGAFKRAFLQDPNTGSVVLGRRDTADTTWAETLNAISDQYTGWYGITVVLNGSTQEAIKTELQEIVEWTASSKKMFFHATADSGCINYQQPLSKGYVVTGRVADVSLWNEISAGSLTIALDSGTATEVIAMDFSSATTLADVVGIISTAVTALDVTVTEVSGKIKFESDTTGKSSKVELTDGVTGTSILSLLNMAYSTSILGFDLG